MAGIREHDFGAFDAVIVGAGMAGCLLANRLSADPFVLAALRKRA